MSEEQKWYIGDGHIVNLIRYVRKKKSIVHFITEEIMEYREEEEKKKLLL